jgi:hypothetical protein
VTNVKNNHRRAGNEEVDFVEMGIGAVQQGRTSTSPFENCGTTGQR